MNAGSFGGGFFQPAFTYRYTNIVPLTAGAVFPGQYGAWVQLAAATKRVRWMILQIFNNSAATPYFTQLGTGLAGAEVVIQPTGGGGGPGGFLAQYDAVGAVQYPWNYSFPVSINPGTRLVARTAANGAGETLNLHVSLWG